jgi:integrase
MPMTLKELYDKAFASGHFATSRQGPMKTHLTKYAKWLSEEWTTCLPSTYHQPDEQVRATILNGLENSDISVKSQQNQVKDVLALFHLAVDQGWLMPIEQSTIAWRTTKRAIDFERERPRVLNGTNTQTYGLGAQPNSVEIQRARGHYNREQAQRKTQGLEPTPFVPPSNPTIAELAPTLAAEIDGYLNWCSPKTARDRPQHIYKTPRIQQRSRLTIARVAGYAVKNGADPTMLTLRSLCDPALLEDLCWWWINDYRGKNTNGLSLHLEEMKTIARYRLGDEALAGEISKIYETLPPEEVVLDKDLRMCTLEELDRIGQSVHPLNPRRVQEMAYLRDISKHLTNPERYPLGCGRDRMKWADGHTLAVWVEYSLILRLLVHRPLRQINLRDAKIDVNLISMGNGHYELRYGGDELKVRQRRVKGRHRQVKANRWVFHFPQTLEPLLHEWLEVWRPKLLRQPSPYLFIGRWGDPYGPNAITRLTERTTWQFTQERPGGPLIINPHQVRTIWATRMLKSGLNIIDVARMLGDRIQTVYDKYVTLADESPPPTPWEVELATAVAQRHD